MSSVSDSSPRSTIAIPLAQRVLGGKYRLVRPLTAGGMGTVWIAEHLNLRSAVAVKLLSREIAETEEAEQRFLREACTAASLRSPHVVQILDHGVEAGTPFIVMELLDGESLATRLQREQRLGPVQTERIVRHVARAVGRAHEAGIVHRDLKPSNIFIVANDEEELVKVLDFGIAKTRDGWSNAHAARTRTGTFLGTPGYVSPEQAEGASNIDHRTDIWSLGVIAFECLLGHPPFVGESFGSLLLAICSRPLPVPSEHGPLPRGFDDWFARACARDPAERFQSAREAARELRRVFELSEGAELGSDRFSPEDSARGNVASAGEITGGSAPEPASGSGVSSAVSARISSAKSSGVASATAVSATVPLASSASSGSARRRVSQPARWALFAAALGVAALGFLGRSWSPSVRGEPLREVRVPAAEQESAVQGLAVKAPASEPVPAARPEPRQPVVRPLLPPPAPPAAPALNGADENAVSRSRERAAAPKPAPTEQRTRTNRPANAAAKPSSPSAPASGRARTSTETQSINLGLVPTEQTR